MRDFSADDSTTRRSNSDFCGDKATIARTVSLRGTITRGAAKSSTALAAYSTCKRRPSGVKQGVV
eukprot:scaffold3234_cov166-Amphora_coffeaeformis.AAC.4